MSLFESKLDYRCLIRTKPLVLTGPILITPKFLFWVFCAAVWGGRHLGAFKGPHLSG